MVPTGDERLLDTLHQLESALRQLGWWEERPPPAEALRSTLPFHADRLAFHQWLQWVLIPGLRERIRRGDPLPGTCAVAPAGAVFWQRQPEAAARLLPLLRTLDRLVTEGGAAED